MSASPDASPDLARLSFDALCARLADRTSTPGGGSMAGGLLAAGSALVAMACRFTSGEKFQTVEGQMAGRVVELDRLRAEGLALVDEDARAYDAVTGAYQLPKQSDAEKAARKAAVQAAMRGALEVPARTLQRALAALRLADAAVPEVNPNLLSDAATGAHCLHAACEAAQLNVRINAASISDAAWAASRLDAATRELGEARALIARVQQAVARRLAG